MLLAINTASGSYKVVLVLHILAAIVGFGSVMLNGVYGAHIARRPGPEGTAIAEANYDVSFGWAIWFIYGLFIFGFGLVGMSDKAWKFSQTWVWLAIVLYLVLIGLVDRQPTSGPIWWLAARVLTAADPAQEAWQAVERLQDDTTAEQLSAALPDGVVLTAVGLGEHLGDGLARRGDVQVLLVETDL